MKSPTITEFKNRIETFVNKLPFSQRRGWNGKHCSEVGRIYKEQLWYINNVLKTFETAQVFYDGKYIHIQYPCGSGKIAYDELELTVLFPEIEAIVQSYGKILFNVNNHLIAA